MRRPLLVSHTAQPGGSNTVLLGLLRHRPADVAPACVFLAPGPVEAQAQALGVPTAVVVAGRSRSVQRWPGVVGRLRAALRTGACDGVFAHTAKGQLYGGMAAALEGVPAIWWQHAVPGQEALTVVADHLPSEAIIASSAWTAALQRRRTRRVPVHVVHPGISVPADPPAAADGLVIGTVGRLQRWKRIELLVDALPAVLAAVPEAHVEIVGAGDPSIDPAYPGELEARVARAGVGDAVTFTGHVADGAGRMAGYALLVHTADREPFGLIFCEALARRVPVVGPAEAGALEIVRDGVDGLLVDVTDAEALAAAVVALLRDPERRAAFGAAGRERVGAHFTVERMAREAWAIAARARPRDRPPRG